jgi:hypothetical protein
VLSIKPIFSFLRFDLREGVGFLAGEGGKSSFFGAGGGLEGSIFGGEGGGGGKSIFLPVGEGPLLLYLKSRLLSFCFVSLVKQTKRQSRHTHEKRQTPRGTCRHTGTSWLLPITVLLVEEKFTKKLSP